MITIVCRSCGGSGERCVRSYDDETEELISCRACNGIGQEPDPSCYGERTDSILISPAKHILAMRAAIKSVEKYVRESRKRK